MATPSTAAFAAADRIYALLSTDSSFDHVRRLMDYDWSQASITVEELGLPRLLQVQAEKLRAALSGAGVDDRGDAADAIRYTERHDALAQAALWWLCQPAPAPTHTRRPS